MSPTNGRAPPMRWSGITGRLSTPLLSLLLLLALRTGPADGTFFMNSCGCGPPVQRRACPPPPPCGPCPACADPNPNFPTLVHNTNNNNNNNFNGNGYNNGLVNARGNYVQTTSAGGTYAPRQVVPSREVYAGPSTFVDNSITPASVLVTVRPPVSHFSPKSVDDVYDEILSQDSLLNDISLDSKKLSPLDVFLRRNRFLKQLRNKALRQFSANTHAEALPQLDERSYQPSVCNNQKLAKIMVKAMVEDITASKRLVRKATELAFDGVKFDVLCANGDFSYSVYAKQYCEATRGNVTCFAFL